VSSSNDSSYRDRPIIAGSRGSRLALQQTQIALDALRRANPGAEFELRTIRPEGDRSSASLAEIGGRGVFVIEIERALLAGEIDLAVHSLKDLPSAETPGLTIGAVLPREDARDALLSREGLTLERLPAGATVATGSPRRAAQLRSLRPDLRLQDIRGNVDTRIRKVEEGQYDAVVLATAGLARLGWLERASQVFSPEEMLPAPGQGALAVQVRSDDADALRFVASADDADTRAAVTAERAFERRLGGGCNAAVAALAEVDGARLRLRGLVADPAGGRSVKGETEGDAADADGLGVELAERLIAQGATAFLEAAT